MIREVRLPLAALALMAGCQTDGARRPDSPGDAPAVPAAAPAQVTIPAPPLPPSAAAGADPTAALTRYLAFESFRGAPAGPDRLVECPPFPPAGEGESDEGWEPDDYVGIVLPTVLGTWLTREDTTGTSATGRAAVTRVVEIGRDSAGWAGSIVRRRDTLMFTLRRSPAGWAVCGPAFKSLKEAESGLAVFVTTYDDAVRTEINGAHWPPGITLESAARHADSVIGAGRR